MRRLSSSWITQGRMAIGVAMDAVAEGLFIQNIIEELFVNHAIVTLEAAM